jgi:hypothetical protein
LDGDRLGRGPWRQPDRADTAQEFGLAWRDRVGAGAQQLTGLQVEEQQRDAFDP